MRIISNGVGRVVTDERAITNDGLIQFYGAIYTVYDEEDKVVSFKYAVMDHDMRDEYMFFEQNPVNHLYKRTAKVPKVLLEHMTRYGVERTMWDGLLH